MKDSISKISKFFIEKNIEFILIGASARDLFFAEKGIELTVKTKDIDFAIVTRDWNEFEEIKKLLISELKLIQDKDKTYRLDYQGIPIDLLPFGDIAKPGTTIRWPGTFRERMQVLGFEEAFKNAGEVVIEGTSIKVVIPEMLVVLKLSSWSHATDRNKDAVDIKLVLENVIELCPDLKDQYYSKEYEWIVTKYGSDSASIWIAFFAYRIKNLLKGTEPYPYIKNMFESDGTLTMLMIAMNNGVTPDPTLEAVLRGLISPFKAGLLESK